MSGFLVVLAPSIELDTAHLDHVGLGPTLRGRRQFNDGFVERFVNPKFPNDKVFDEDQELFVVIEGAILNSNDLCEQYKCSDLFGTLKVMYRQHGEKLANHLRGEFAGALYDKTTDKWVLFTNHTSSKQLFYYHDDDLFLCSTEFQAVTQMLRTLKRSVNLEMTGAYCLLTFGYMLEDYTLVENVKKLRPGCCIVMERGRMSTDTYFVWRNDIKVESSKEEIIERMDELFNKAVSLEYSKDREYGYRHIATLSGGLDSRMSVLCAKELGFEDILNINWCQNKHDDEQTAREIASDIGEGLLFYALDNGNYLTNTIRDAVVSNGGLVLYAGSAHLLSCVKTINFDQFGLLHTGMIGDAVLGSFITESRPRPADPLAGAYSRFLGDRISPVSSKIVAEYESEEMFKFYNRCFNGALNGNWTTHQFTEAGSPFLDVDFCEYCLTIPTEMRQGEQIYVDWILAKHRCFAKYAWAATKAKLTDHRITALVKRYLWISKVRLLGRADLLSMNPMEHWLKTNSKLQRYVDTYFERSIFALDGYKELRKDTETLFRQGTFLEKTQAMTVLEAAKLHLGLA